MFNFQQMTCFHATWRNTQKTTDSVACDKTKRMTSTGPATQEERLREQKAPIESSKAVNIRRQAPNMPGLE